MQVLAKQFMPLVGWFVSCLLAISALAWSAHIDLPATDPASDSGAPIVLTAGNVSDRDAGDLADSDNSNLDENSGGHNSSCEHASSHLLALGGDTSHVLAKTGSALPGGDNALYRGPSHALLIEPPIA